MNYNEQVKYEVPIMITCIPDNTIHKEKESNKTTKLSDIITIKK
jgi:hypothetical protein